MKGQNIAKNLGKKVGNGSKATLPNGQKLSDKIKDNKTKNKLGGAGNKKGGSDKSKNGKDKQKKPGAMGDTAQQVGTEAAKQALKLAADVIPYTKWIPKGIRDAIIDKFMDSGMGQAAVEKALKDTKNMLIMIIIINVASIIFFLIFIGAVFGVISAPVSFVTDAVDAVGDFFASVWNAIQGKGWCSSDAVCQADAQADYYEELKEVVKKYKDDQCPINEDLITATIFYGQMVSQDKFNNQADEDEENPFYFDYLDVSESTGWQNAKDEIEDLAEVYTTGEEAGENSDDNEKKCNVNAEKYKDYLINTYIGDNYPSVINKDRTKEKIAEEILIMGNVNIGGENGTSGEVIVGAGVAGAIPNQILSNSVSPLGSQNTTHTSCYGYYGAQNCTAHTGIDLSSNLADPILYSIADGEVVTVISSAVHCQPDWKNGKACSVCAQSAGNKVSIKHTVEVDGVTYQFYSEYLHMKSVSVTLGQKVAKGEKIGVMGNTGCSTGKHLHFNMLDGSKKRYNPEELLQYLGLPIRSDCEEARRVCSR